MKLKIKETGHVFHADDDAGKELIDRGDYEVAGKDEPLFGETTTEPVAAKPVQTKRKKRG